MESGAGTPRAVPVPRGWLAQFLIGSIVVIGLFVGGLVATDHSVGNLVDDIRAAGVASCAGTASPDCRAHYPATITEIEPGDSNRLVLHTGFLADTSQTDECFGNDCRDAVQLRSSDGKELRVGEQVTIEAGKGRIYTVAADRTSWPTYDNPSISVLNTASNLTWTLYLDAFAVAWLVAYLFLILGFHVWRIAATTLRRGINVVTVVSAIGSIVTFLAFGLGGGTELLLLATGLLISAGAGLLVRRHPEAQRPVADFVADTRWKPALDRAAMDAFYLLGAFPLPLSLAVALLLAHDDGTVISPIVVVLIGLALTVFIQYRMRRRRKTGPKARSAAGR